MYPVKTVQQTALAKKLGGVPVFHDGILKKIVIDEEAAILHIKILVDNNPRLKQNTVVQLKLNDVKAFDFKSETIDGGLFVIHDLDIRKEHEHLHLRMESIDGTVNFVQFTSIELTG